MEILKVNIKLIDWIAYNPDEPYFNPKSGYPETYINTSSELKNLLNKNKRLFIPKDDPEVLKLAKKERIDKKTAHYLVEKKNDELPLYTDEVKAQYYKDIEAECLKVLKKYCIDNITKV